MKNSASKASKWFFSAILWVVPAVGLADSFTVTICAHPEGLPKWKIDADVTVMQNGAAIPVTPQPLDDNCMRVDLPVCDSAVVIEASVPRSYRGRAACSTDPSPMLIAMQANQVEILTIAFAETLGDGLPGFDRASFLSEIARTEELLSELPVKGQQAVDALYAALATRNYPAAQRQATEVAGFLRNVGEVRLSLAYSSITYVAGFQAIGLDALASENPLVAVGPTPSSVVLNEQGRDVLELYQSARAIPAQLGVWDFPTTASVATVTPFTMQEISAQSSTGARGSVTPKALNINDFSIDAAGRIDFR
jgi:hypothetical protein